MIEKQTNLEIMKDIIATISIVIKLEAEGDILSSQSILVAFLSELGFTTTRGVELNTMNFRSMFGKLTHKQRQEVLSEFSIQRDCDLLDVMRRCL